MRAVVIIFLLAVSPICMTTKSYANDIFLKCSSLSFGGQVWEGNVSYVKIYPDKNEALFQDTGETTSYWINHKIRSINPDQILHVGDNMENDVLGGKRAGCKTAWLAVNRPMNLINEAVTCLPDLVLDDLSELESLFGR